jgi:hypothetical protein
MHSLTCPHCPHCLTLPSGRRIALSMPTLPCHCAHCALTSLSFPSRAVAFPSLFPVPIPCPLCPHIALPVISLAAHRPLFGRMTLFLLTALSFPCPWSYCTLSSLPFRYPPCPVHVFALTAISLPSLCSHVPPIALHLLSPSSHCPVSTLTASQWPLLGGNTASHRINRQSENTGGNSSGM